MAAAAAVAALRRPGAGPARLRRLVRRRRSARPRPGTLLVRPARRGAAAQHRARCWSAACVAQHACSASATAWLVERTDLPGTALWHALLVRRWRCRPSSTATPGSRTTHAVQGYAARCWSSRCPTTRWSTCRWWRRCAASTRRWRRSRAGARASAGGEALRSGRRCRSSRPAVLGGALLVGLHAAGRVRRAADAALPDLHHRDLRPVPLGLQQRRRPTCWPACWCWLPAAAHPRAAGCAAARRRARVGRGHRAPRRPALRLGAGPLPVVAGLEPARRCSPRACRCRAWCTGCVGGSSTAFPVGRRRAPPPVSTVALAGVGRAVTTVAGAAGRAGSAVRHPALVVHGARARDVHRPRPARHRGRAGAGHRVDPRWLPALYQTAAAAARRLRDAVPAARDGQRARRRSSRRRRVLDDVARSLGLSPLRRCAG